MRNGRMRRVREFLREFGAPGPGHHPRPNPSAPLPPSGSGEFRAGYRAGVGFALSLLPAEDADLTLWDLGGVRRQLKDRA